jgi:hypothetical protein
MTVRLLELGVEVVEQLDAAALGSIGGASTATVWPVGSPFMLLTKLRRFVGSADSTVFYCSTGVMFGFIVRHENE